MTQRSDAILEVSNVQGYDDEDVSSGTRMRFGWHAGTTIQTLCFLLSVVPVYGLETPICAYAAMGIRPS